MWPPLGGKKHPKSAPHTGLVFVYKVRTERKITLVNKSRCLATTCCNLSADLALFDNDLAQCLSRTTVNRDCYSKMQNAEQKPIL
uniref:Uncharacterized protein n=1 Tax=Romanomermis culicivorax TaxID=13658 RepID=A0A915IDD9_ROMCU